MGAPTRLHEPFERCLAAEPQRTFLRTHSGAVTFAQLAARVERVEALLRARGIAPGDRVLLVAENCADQIAALLAVSRAGAWSCGVNARMAPAEVDAIAEQADARLVLCMPMASAEAGAHAARWHATAVEGLDLHAAPPRAARPATQDELAADVAALIFTSGTTGRPKGVMVTHRGLLHFAQVSAASRGLGPQDLSYAFLPMTHVFGLATMLMASLHAGAALALRARFDPDDLLEALAHDGITLLQGPPAAYARLLAHLASLGRPVVAPRLRYLYTGAAPLDVDLKRHIEAAFGLPLHHGYGLSEYAGSVHLTRMEAPRDDASAGYLVEGAELQVVDAAGRPLAPGATGELWIRGTGLMAGYFRDPDATAAVMRPGGWYATGDLGRVEADGALFVSGRLKELIIRSGFNVYPAEVEAAIDAFPGVRLSAVVGRAAGDGNEEVVAFVEVEERAQLDRAALDAFLRTRLAPYKRPGELIVVPKIPVTHTGKVRKQGLGP